MEKKLIDDSRAISRRNFLKATMALGGVMALNRGVFAQTAETQGFTSLFTTREHFDTIIANGLVYDGGGATPFKGGVGIRDGKITAVGVDLGKSCAEYVDAKGCAISPGFIDIHGHTDTNLLECPFGDSKIFQGITSDIGGNCGYGPFPSVKDIRGERWKNVNGFFDDLRKNTMGLNYNSYVGHGELRDLAVGDYDVPTTPEQLKLMCDILETQLEMGAVGLSFGLEYTPGSYGRTDEFIALLKVVAKHDKLYAIHMRNEDDRVEEAIAEAISLAKASGARLEISHLKAQNQNNWHKVPNMLKLIHDAAAEGIDIHFDRYPYTAFHTGLDCFIPLQQRQGSKDEILSRLNDPVQGKIIENYALGRVKRLGGPHCILIAACFAPGNDKYTGKFLDECCALSGMDVWPTIKYLLESERLNVNMAGFAMKEDNLRAILNDPLAMVITDGSVYSPEGRLGKEAPHPRSYGTFPNYLGKYVRDKHFCDLQTAITKCTSLPAHQLKLKDRGWLKVGYWGDVVVFDPATIADRSTYAQPHQFPVGINHVFVNGSHEIADGRRVPACKLAGVIL